MTKNNLRAFRLHNQIGLILIILEL
uniref:Uncharacterized protein n=1 Tax=Lepeophtheirus salmonis TaxID=72036 RepID=A0A0K2VDH1_LEPSM